MQTGNRENLNKPVIISVKQMSAPKSKRPVANDDDDDDDTPLPRAHKKPAPAQALLVQRPAAAAAAAVEEDDDDDTPIKRRGATTTARDDDDVGKVVNNDDDDDEDDKVIPPKRSKEADAARLRAELVQAQGDLRAAQEAVARHKARVDTLERAIKAIAAPAPAKDFQLVYDAAELLSWRDPTWPASDTVGTGIDDAVRMLRERLHLADVDLAAVSIRVDMRKIKGLCSVAIAGADKTEIRLVLHCQVIQETQRVSVEDAVDFLVVAARTLLACKARGDSLLDAAAGLRPPTLTWLRAQHKYRSRVAETRANEPPLKTGEDVQRIADLVVARMGKPECTARRITYNKKLKTHAYQLKREHFCMRPGFIWDNPPRNVFNKMLFAFCDWFITTRCPHINSAFRSEEVDALVVRLGGRIEHFMYTRVRE